MTNIIRNCPVKILSKRIGYLSKRMILLPLAKRAVAILLFLVRTPFIKSTDPSSFGNNRGEKLSESFLINSCSFFDCKKFQV